MERLKPETTWHSSRARPPFSKMTFESLSRDPQADQAIREAKEKATINGIVHNIGEDKFDEMISQHADGEQ